MYYKITNPEFCDFFDLNPTPSLSYLPDIDRDGFVNLYLKDRRSNMSDLLAKEPIPTEFRMYREGPNVILRVTFQTGSPRGDYWAETEFRADVPQQVDALKRLFGQERLDIHIIDDEFYFLTTKQYRNAVLNRSKSFIGDL